MGNRISAPLLCVALLGLAMPAFAQNKAGYEAALDKVYDLTYGAEISSVDINEGVAKFKTNVTKREEAKTCPALKTALEDFADKEFREAMTSFFQSPKLEESIKGAMRKQLTQADLDAFLAFAGSPAGKQYLDHQRASKAEVERVVSESTEALEDSPEFQKMMSDMVVKLLPVMMKCKQ